MVRRASCFAGVGFLLLASAGTLTNAIWFQVAEPRLVASFPGVPMTRTLMQLGAAGTSTATSGSGWFAPYWAAFAAAPEKAWAAFRLLLGDRRVRVDPDPERGFRVEGCSSGAPKREAPGSMTRTGASLRW